MCGVKCALVLCVCVSVNATHMWLTSTASFSRVQKHPDYCVGLLLLQARGCGARAPQNLNMKNNEGQRYQEAQSCSEEQTTLSFCTHLSRSVSEC